MSVYHLLTDFLGKLGAKMLGFFTESIVSNKIVAICCASH